MNIAARDGVREVVDALLAEDRHHLMKDRRAVQRIPFIRPTTIYLGRDCQEPMAAFTRDISHLGFGMVHNFPIEVNRVANVAIYRLWDEPTILRAQVLWCEAWGRGWWISGWSILNVEVV